MAAIALGVLVVAAGIFMLWRRQKLARVGVAEIGVFGARETPAWTDFFHLTAAVRGVLAIVIGVLLIAYGAANL